MSSDTHDIKSEVKGYRKVFFALMVLTVVTVLASNLKIGMTLGIILALVIATVKAGMVACHFMHLKTERKSIYMILILTAIFFMFMISIFCFAYFNVPEGLHYVS